MTRAGFRQMPSGEKELKELQSKKVKMFSLAAF
jgi:hypothetical protein